ARRPLGRRHAGMVGELAAARLQLLRVARRFVARAVLDALQGRDARERIVGRDSRGPHNNRNQRAAGYTLRLSRAGDLAVRGGAGGDVLARLVDLVGARVRVGIDPAGDRLHRVVLAQQEGGDRGGFLGDGAVTRREFVPASVPAVRRGDALDVSGLPSYGFAHRSLMWWGNAGMMTIEGVAFGFMIVIYFYLRSLSNAWPYGGHAPDLLFGNINLAIIVASAIPNRL